MQVERRAEAAPAIQLTILRRGSANIVDLAEVGSLIPRSETEVDAAFLAELAEEMAHLAGATRASSVRGLSRQMERVGALVFSHLLTEPARKKLRDSPPCDLHLRLDEQLVHVPWELCHDGESFLAAKFRVGRQVITTQPIPERRTPPSPLERLRVLLVADPTETLPSASREAEQICALLDGVPNVEVTLLGGRGVRRIPLLAALQDHDVVHFAGHSRYDPDEPSRSGWLLAEGVLTAGELSKLARPPVLVFSNSCEAGTTAEWNDEQRYEGRAFGIGSAFLLGGVPNYVGTFWVVHDDESVLFATSCYQALAAGARLGDAMAEARQAVIGAHGWDRLTWASYLLYGDPGFRPLPSGTGAVLPATTPRPAGDALRYHVALPKAGEAPQVGLITTTSSHVVGREPEQARLESALEAARGGRRQVVFVSGPPGIGKTTVLDRFLGEAVRRPATWVAQGQAIEQYGAGEAYLPLLEALGRLCRRPDAEALRAAVERHAPCWLAQLPGLLTDAELDRLRPRLQGTRERMVRELAELIEVVTRDQTLVLALEDLHWSDHSTLELLAYLAQRREPARFLLVATYRPAEVMSGEHPLRPLVQELRARRHAEELALAPLGPSEVGQYLDDRLRGAVVPGGLTDALHRRTDGHPLFLVNVVDYLLRQELVVEEAGRWALRADAGELGALVPDDLRAVIERQIEALAEPERLALEAASVVGAECSVAAVAAALETSLDALEETFEGLAWRGQFVRAAGVEEWPDGTIAGHYRFVHALYQNVLYERIAPARRVRLHRRVAAAKERAYGTRTVEIAGELAAHAEAARDPRRALEYRLSAGEVAIERHADHEAIVHLERGLALLEAIPEDRGDRGLRELTFLVRLVTPLMSVRGYAAPEVGRALVRARELGHELPAETYLPIILRGLMSFFQVRTEYAAAHEAGVEMLALCDETDDVAARVQAHYGHGVTLFDLGQIDEARDHLERALALYDPATHAGHLAAYGGYDPGVACRAWRAWIDVLSGWPERAVATGIEAVALAETLGHPFSAVWAEQTMGIIHLYRSEPSLALARIETAIEGARKHGFAFQAAVGSVLKGWALLTEGKAAEAEPLIRVGIDACKATGARHSIPAHLTTLAAAVAFQGRVAEGLGLIDEGLAICERNGSPVHVVELRRIQGLLLALSSAPAATVEAALRQAVEVARRHGMRWLELRAALDLAKLWQQSERAAEVPALLGPLCDWFVEGGDMPELRQARALLTG